MQLLRYIVSYTLDYNIKLNMTTQNQIFKEHTYHLETSLLIFY